MMQKIASLTIFTCLVVFSLAAYGQQQTKRNETGSSVFDPGPIARGDTRNVSANALCVCPCHCQCYDCFYYHGIDTFRDKCGCTCEPGKDYPYYDSTAFPPTGDEDYSTTTVEEVVTTTIIEEEATTAQLTREEETTTEESQEKETTPPGPPIDHCRGFRSLSLTVSVMGHEPIIFEGDCFDRCGTDVTCTFNDPVKGPIQVKGRIDAPLFARPRAICYAPYLYTLDPVTVDVAIRLPDGVVVKKSTSIIIDRSSPFLELSYSDGASFFNLRHQDMSKVALTSDIATVDLILVWYNAETREFEDLSLLQAGAKYQTNAWFRVNLPALSSLTSKAGALASTFVAVAVRPSLLTANIVHPFAHEAAIFSAFYPSMYFDRSLRQKWSSGVCKAWHVYTPKIKPPVDCPAKMSGMDYSIFGRKKLNQYSAAVSQASMGRYRANDFETITPIGQFGFGHECYYDASGNLLDGFQNAAGTADLISGYKDEREHYFHDEIPWYACCSQDDTSSLCGLYYDARKSKR